MHLPSSCKILWKRLWIIVGDHVLHCRIVIVFCEVVFDISYSSGHMEWAPTTSFQKMVLHAHVKTMQMSVWPDPGMQWGWWWAIFVALTKNACELSARFSICQYRVTINIYLFATFFVTSASWVIFMELFWDDWLQFWSDDHSGSPKHLPLPAHIYLNGAPMSDKLVYTVASTLPNRVSFSVAWPICDHSS